MAEDKVNIGLTNEANEVAEKIAELGYFEDKLDIAKFAFSYAIKSGLDKKINEFNIGDGRGASWNVGSFDGDKYLYNFTISLFPDIQTPYRQIELIMNVGLIELGKIIKESGLSGISDLM
jgi:hypothetical protein